VTTAPWESPKRGSTGRVSLLRADDAAGHARNPYLAVLFVGADPGDDGFPDPLPRRFVDVLKRRNGEQDLLADHLPIPRGRSRYEFYLDVPLGDLVQPGGLVQRTDTSRDSTPEHSGPVRTCRSRAGA
jgi:hypothetical protein